jgi:hypothetical protein
MSFIRTKFASEEVRSIKIILDSIIEAVSFYEHIGFKWVKTNQYNEHLNIPEKSTEEHFVMVYEMN